MRKISGRNLSQPAAHYSTEWQNCTIKHFIVPLYHKIYLEAYEAKNFIYKFLVQGPEPLAPNSELLIRFFLASGRSFKDSIALNRSFQSDVRDVILELPMPKFVWIAEISNKTLIKQGKANGLVILDATEANTHFNKPLILATYQNKLIKFGNNGLLMNFVINLQPFDIYTRNLRNL